MPTLVVTNNGPNPSALYDPETEFSVLVAPNATTSRRVSSKTITNLEAQIAELRAKVDDAGDPIFDVQVNQNTDEGNADTQQAYADVTRWVANHVAVDMAESNPSLASVVGAWRIDHNAGEAYVDGKHFVVAAATDEVGDASVDKDGAVFAGPLGAGEDRYAHFLLVNNAGVLEKLFVFGDAAGTGLAVALTRDQLATAVGAYLGLSTPSYGYVESAQILFSETGSLGQTTTSYRPVPASY